MQVSCSEQCVRAAASLNMHLYLTLLVQEQTASEAGRGTSSNPTMPPIDLIYR